MPWYLRIIYWIETALYIFIFSILMAGSTQLVPRQPGEAVRRYTRPVEFDFVNWTLQAFGVKLSQAALGTPSYFEAGSRHQIVVDYMSLMDTILQDESRLNLIYTDPSVKDPLAASTDLRAELAGLYTRQRQLAPLAESILQEQVSTVLAEQGLTTGGQPIPAVEFHLTPLPFNLIVSPRDKIEAIASISLAPDLTVDQQVALEDRVDSALDVSALVVPVGGLGTYPTMVQRTTNLTWLSDTIAHEWIHNWLTLRPLGINYASTSALRTMNETTASIAGGEISQAVLQCYYPELLKQTPLQSQTISLQNAPAAAFDFRAEMHTTRVRVDELLAAGKIDEAETYMEQRRQFFWDNGNAIRKLNQAYFAFHGAYADVPGGAAGEDPVGPAVRRLRAQSRSLADFLETIGRMSSFQQLQAAISP